MKSLEGMPPSSTDGIDFAGVRDFSVVFLSHSLNSLHTIQLLISLYESVLNSRTSLALLLACCFTSRPTILYQISLLRRCFRDSRPRAAVPFVESERGWSGISCQFIGHQIRFQSPTHKSKIRPEELGPGDVSCTRGCFNSGRICISAHVFHKSCCIT